MSSGPSNQEPGVPYSQSQQGYNQPYFPPPPGNAYSDHPQHHGYNSPPPQNRTYDPQTGSPIPPGFVPPMQPPPGTGYDPKNFAPPPRGGYRDDGYGPPPPQSEYDRGYDRAAPSDYDAPYSGYGKFDRPYAPPESERYAHSANQLAPYDEEKAEAEYWRGQEQQRRYNVPPPPSDAELSERRYRERGYDRYDDRYDDRSYDDRDRRSYDDRSSYDSRDRRDSDRRRRDSRHSPTKSNGKDILGGREGERGLGAQILGGAVGGIAGHEFGGGVLETLAGVAAGAIGAKVLENQHEKRKNRKDEEKRAGAPYKGDMIPRDRVVNPKDRWPRDDRGDIKRARRRRSSGRRSDSDSYSSDGSPPPRRR